MDRVHFEYISSPFRVHFEFISSTFRVHFEYILSTFRANFEHISKVKTVFWSKIFQHRPIKLYTWIYISYITVYLDLYILLNCIPGSVYPI